MFDRSREDARANEKVFESLAVALWTTCRRETSMTPQVAIEVPQDVALKFCPRCETPKPIDSFGIQRNLPSGRNYYCKECNRLKTQRAREKLRASGYKRKPCVVSPKVKVCEAIRAGYRTRRALRHHTKLDWDSLVDTIAVLQFDDEVITSRFINGDAVFLLKQTA